MDIYIELLKITKEENIKKNESMKLHTSFKIGGNAEWFVSLNEIDEIKRLVLFIKENNIPLFVIGNGTNLLVNDNGVKGIVLKINLDHIEIKNKENDIYVTVGSGVKLIPLALNLAQNNISGFEFASGIPGTIGGAIHMNAGAYGNEMKDIVVSTKYMDYEGNIVVINNKEHEFKYRNSIFTKKEAIILETVLKLEVGKYDQIKQKMDEYKEKRINTQPMNLPNAGSTFKRGDKFITAKLIDEAGLKGYSIGDAEISTKHAGFIVNKGNATAKEVLELAEYVKKKVYEKFGEIIELEIEVI